MRIENLGPEHEAKLIEASLGSADLHDQWVTTPKTSEEFVAQLKRYDSKTDYGFLCVNENHDLVAWISITGIVRGVFQSGYMGYCAFSPFDGKGLMRDAMKLVIAHVFEDLQLHRLEANIQPANTKSINLVTSLGFRLEGLSPRYLKIRGEWRDHQRYAITAEEFEG